MSSGPDQRPQEQQRLSPRPRPPRPPRPPGGPDESTCSVILTPSRTWRLCCSTIQHVAAHLSPWKRQWFDNYLRSQLSCCGWNLWSGLNTMVQKLLFLCCCSSSVSSSLLKTTSPRGGRREVWWGCPGRQVRLHDGGRDVQDKLHLEIQS